MQSTDIGADAQNSMRPEAAVRRGCTAMLWAVAAWACCAPGFAQAPTGDTTDATETAADETSGDQADPSHEATATSAEPTPSAAAEEDEPEQDEAPPAPDVAVLSVGGDASRTQARRARRAVAAALVAEGMTPVPDADVALQVSPSALAACSDAACAYTFAAPLNVRMVAVVTTWAGDDGPSSLTVSLLLGPRRSHSATEDVGDDGLQRAATRAVRGAQESRRQALLVSGVSAEPDDPTEIDEPEPNERQESFLNRDRPLEQWVLPSLLGIVGIGLVGTAVYALLDEQCDQFAASNPEICLRGTRPNYGLGILFSVTGALSIAGAILWLVVGGEPAQTGTIDVVLSPEGGGASYSGRF